MGNWGASSSSSTPPPTSSFSSLAPFVETVRRRRPAALPPEVRRLAARIPYPLFFIGGALLGILIAMAIVISVQGEMPQTKLNAAPPPRTVAPARATEVQHAHLLFVWRPQLVATRSGFASASASVDQPAIAMEPPHAPRQHTIAMNRPRAERQQPQAVAAAPAPVLNNLLSAGL